MSSITMSQPSESKGPSGISGPEVTLTPADRQCGELQQL